MDELSGWESPGTMAQSPSQVIGDIHGGTHPRQDTKQSQNHLRRSSQAGEMAQLDKHLLGGLSRAPNTHVQSWAQWHMPIDANTREAERGDVTPWISLASSRFSEVSCLKKKKKYSQEPLRKTHNVNLWAPTNCYTCTCTHMYRLRGAVVRRGGEREYIDFRKAGLPKF